MAIGRFGGGPRMTGFADGVVSRGVVCAGGGGSLDWKGDRRLILGGYLRGLKSAPPLSLNV
jgi:hypothetical protein